MTSVLREAARLVASSIAVALSVGVLVAAASAQERNATCNTFNASNEPASSFRGGEKIVVRGSGFFPRSTVLLSVQQNTQSLEIGKVTANDLGAFELSDAFVPEAVTSGKAAIRALDARNSATCAVTLRAGTRLKGDDALKPVLIAWGILLAIFAVVLGVLSYRRWKADRLREAFDRLAWNDQESDPGRDDQGFAPDPFADDDSEVSHEEFMARLRPPSDFPPPPPPRIDMPMWRDNGGPQAPRQTSDAIEKLRREVKDWKR